MAIKLYLLVGITPAYAGKSFAKTIRVPQSRDHPRLCGEKCRLYAMQTAGTGSPPPMRGKELTFGRSAPRSRITPAYAGKRRRKSELPETLQDHPRLCGEKQTCYTAYSGKPGITPAYAGKSFQLGDVPAVQKDHPRLCGEKRRSEFLHTIPAGSPPPMRGKGVHAEPSAAVIGITPAYAGKSSCGGQTRFPCRDHPRLCGEKLKRQIESKQLKGSPPPMRGKGMRTIKAFPDRRITPAYAGKSEAG